MTSAAEKIEARIARLEQMKANYLGYLQFRIADEDWHGTWDAGVNISEVHSEIAGLLFALAAIAEDS